jgi:protein involved in polysaccharide export with SLBB domain
MLIDAMVRKALSRGLCVPLAGMFLLCAVPAAATTLHPGDKVQVNVLNHPELLTQTVLDSQGRVSLPVVGLVPANNMEPAQLAQSIREKLKPYVRKPAVEVQIIQQGQTIFIAGGPGGTLPYAPGETLSGALGQLQQTPIAGSYSAGTAGSSPPDQLAMHDLAVGAIDLHRVVIARDGHDSAPIDAAALFSQGDPGPVLEPDDTIKLADKPVAVHVTGEVRQPGIAHLAADDPLSRALVQVGGTNGPSSSVNFALERGGTRKLITSSSPEYSQPAQPGDLIDVQHAVLVSVVGLVAKPGEVTLRGDSTLLSALYNAGGPQDSGDLKHVQVVHQGKSDTYNVTDLTHGAASQNPQLSDGDTVFVPVSHKLNFGMIFQAILALHYIPL